MRITPRVRLVYLALVLTAYTPNALAKMWGCASQGERRSVLYLADQGARSYVKFSGQRISAEFSTQNSEMRWAWGANAMVLDDKGVARYYEGDTLKAQFKCKKLK